MAKQLTWLKCGRRTVSETVKVSVGKLVSGEWEKWRQYEGPTLEIVPTENLLWPQKRPYNNVTCLAFPSSHVDMDVADS